MQLPTEPIGTCPNDLRPGTRIAIVGEAPGREEVATGQPFVGASGRLLWAILNNNGISRHQCSVLNVCTIQPPDNDIQAFSWDGPELTEGREVLAKQLADLKPNIVLCLGATALNAAKGESDWTHGITDWTGSLFWSPIWNCKCLACLHPESILRQYTWLIHLRVACKRLAEEAATRDLHLPDYRFTTEPKLDTILHHLNDLVLNPRPVAMDIEGGLGTMSCISFATSDLDAFIVPLTRIDGSSYWPLDDEHQIQHALTRVISNPAIPKILQNYLYDSMVLAHGYHMPILGLADDTMLKHWEVLPECEKSLAVQASLYTRQPYWKDARSTTGDTLWRYCCTDSAVTYQINSHLETVLSKQPLGHGHYRFNVELLPALLYMQLRGIKFDRAEAHRQRTLLENEIYELQHKCNCYVVTNWPADSAEAVAVAASNCCYKRIPVTCAQDLLAAPKADYAAEIYRIADIAARWPNVNFADRGYFASRVGLGINVDSNKQMTTLLYDTWKLPKMFKKVRGRLTTKVTADQLSMLDLYVKTKDARVLDLLRLRGKIDQLTQLNIACDSDGRVRSSFNLVGTETGRINSYTSITGSGTNLTTIPKKYRKLYVAD